MSKKLVLLIPFALACSSGGSGQPAASGQQPIGLGGLIAQSQAPSSAEQPEPAEPEVDAPMPFEQGEAAPPESAPPGSAPPAAPPAASSGGLCATLCDRVAACKIATREACMPVCAPQVPQLTPEQTAQVVATMGNLSCDEVAGFAAQAGGQAGAGQQGTESVDDRDEGNEE